LDLEGDTFPALDLLSSPWARRMQDASAKSDVIFMVTVFLIEK